VNIDLQSSPPKHLLGIADLNLSQLELLIGNAELLNEVLERDIKKVPTLRGKGVINLFLEPSTRTRISFELAAKRMSADAVNMSASGSSVSKGESLYDMAQTLEAMAPDVLVIRHGFSGAAHFLASHLTRTSVVNAGDGGHEHPTQALLDLLTLKRHFGAMPRGKTIAIVGDILHSRVARSNILANQMLGNDVRLVGPPTLVPRELEQAYGAGVTVTHHLQEGLEGVSVVMCLRMQRERMASQFVPDLDEYARNYGVSEQALKLCQPECVVLHPGPLNRGVEITTAVADGDRALITNQVTSGLAVRMAVLHAVVAASGRKHLEGEG
jgi:aspartate carbamoyltransferase catalytic subunit